MQKKQYAKKATVAILAILMVFSVGCASQKAKQNQITQNAQKQQSLQVSPNAVSPNVVIPNGANPNAMNPDGVRSNEGTRNNRVQIADQVADKIVGLKEVLKANVLITGRNAFVAAELADNQKQLPRALEDQIAQQVRATDPTIQNVYVSVNPDFVGRVQSYVRDVQQGKPVAGFVEEFKEIVRRVFPKAK